MILRVNSVNEVGERLLQMDKDNPECEVIIPGKGRFKIILQSEDNRTIQDDVTAASSLGDMIKASREDYKNKNYVTSEELIQKIKETDFNNEK
jgi:nitrate reductase NapAB chaperone NapD